MSRVLRWIFNRWVLAAVLLLAVSMVVWVVGPLVSVGEARPLESARARLVTLGVLALLVFGALAWARWRARGRHQAVVQQLAAAPVAEAGSADLAAVRQRFEAALATLRRARFGPDGIVSGWRARLDGRYLHELPWYLIIGAPGSGKTTALRHSGLHFPLAATLGDEAVQGVGGTRHCDWWFTDRAVLIDTAGRFTTQDSDREADRATWQGFLGLLKHARPRQPLNGVLVTVSLTDLLTRSPEQRARHAATVRQRLKEVDEQLRQRVPVYLLVTKTDLLSGFTEWFSPLDKAQRATPWGFTVPREGADASVLRRFVPEFDLLLQRLTDGLVDRLQHERDPQRRARLYGFPAQFATLRPLLHDFLHAAFAPSAFEPEPMLRGLYFVSGTQEGTPIDRVLGAVARGYRLERAVLPPQLASGRSYFLQRLLGEVVFAEAGLGGIDTRWARRRQWAFAGAYAAVGLACVGLLAAWGTSYVANRRYVAEVSARADGVRQALLATPSRATPDLLPLMPALAATRSLAGGLEHVPWSLGWGLFQGRKLDSAAHAAYVRMLADAVLPRLSLRIEEQLRAAGESPETQYEALKAYLMLHDPAHFDAEALRAHVLADWDANRRELGEAPRAEMAAHLDVLLAQGAVVSPLASDPELVSSTRTRLAGSTLPERVWRRLRDQGLGTGFAEFTVDHAAGPNAALVFTRASGAPLTRGVPGLFTRDAYLRGFQKQVAAAATQLEQEQGWVLGVQEAPRDAASRVRGDTLVDDVRRLYLADYANTWAAFVDDLRLQPMSSLTQSVQMSRILSAPDSPLPVLLRAISRETTLAGAPRSVVEQAADRAAGVVGNTREKLASLLAERGAGPDTPAGPPPESLVDDRFAALRQLVTAPPGGKAPIDDTLALIAQVNLMLNAAETAIQGGSTPPASPLPNQVRTEAARMPQPVRGMLDELSTRSAQVSQLLVRQNLGQDVRSQVGEFCQQAIAGRYPLDRASSRDATPADFAQLFGPGGRMDQLFQQKLAPYVDTTTRPWRFRAVDGTPLGGDTGSLPQFQRAQAIRETFFPAGAGSPMRLEFKPLEMDAGITQFVLDVDGQLVRYAHGPQISTAVQWPGPRGSSQVSVQLTPAGASGGGLVTQGPWALFRLLDRVRVEPTHAPERIRVTFDIDGRKAVFEVTASSVRNPFQLRELHEFSCPSAL